MLDIQFIRDNAKLVQEKSDQKQTKVSISDLLKLDAQRRELLSKIEALRAERNQLADTLKSGNPSAEQIERGRQVKQQIAETEVLLEPITASFDQLLKSVPNMSLEDVPVGATEEENVVAKRSANLHSLILNRGTTANR